MVAARAITSPVFSALSTKLIRYVVKTPSKNALVRWITTVKVEFNVMNPRIIWTTKSAIADIQLAL